MAPIGASFDSDGLNQPEPLPFNKVSLRIEDTIKNLGVHFTKVSCIPFIRKLHTENIEDVYMISVFDIDDINERIRNKDRELYALRPMRVGSDVSNEELLLLGGVNFTLATLYLIDGIIYSGHINNLSANIRAVEAIALATDYKEDIRFKGGNVTYRLVYNYASSERSWIVESIDDNVEIDEAVRESLAKTAATFSILPDYQGNSSFMAN